MNRKESSWRVIPVGVDRALIQTTEGRQIVGLIAREDAELIVRAVRELRRFGQRVGSSEPRPRPYRQIEIEDDRGIVRKVLS